MIMNATATTTRNLSLEQQPSWLMDISARSERRFAELSSPERLPAKSGKNRDENYRYFSLKDMEFDRQPSQSQFDDAIDLSTELEELDTEEVATALLSGGGFLRVKIRDEAKLAAQGVFVGDLVAALDRFSSEEIQGWLGLPFALEEDLFAHLAAARGRSALVVHVPRNIRVEGVIRLVHGFDAQSGATFPRTIIVAEAGSEVTCVEEFIGSGLANGKPPFASGLLQVRAGEGASVRLAQVQDLGKGVQAVMRQSLLAERDASIQMCSVALGGARSQTRLESECLGPGASIRVLGAVRGDDRQLFDCWVNARHDVTDSSSSMEYWMVMADSARAVFNGNIAITPKGVRTEALQRNRAMLLSSKAEVNADPKLEIAVDDVKCAHGASVSPIDLEQLYFMQSRGVSRRDAELMIINGFTDPVIRHLPTESLKQRVTDALERKHALTTEAP